MPLPVLGKFAESSDEDEDANKKLLKSETIPETSNQAGETSKPFLHESESLRAKPQFHEKNSHIKYVTPGLMSLSPFSYQVQPGRKIFQDFNCEHLLYGLLTLNCDWHAGKLNVKKCLQTCYLLI